MLQKIKRNQKLICKIIHNSYTIEFYLDYFKINITIIITINIDNKFN